MPMISQALQRVRPSATMTITQMARDKKAKDGRVPFVLAPRIGAFRIVYDVPATEIRDAIASLAS